MSDPNRSAATVLLWKLFFNISQLVVTIAVLSRAGRQRSPIDNTISQWQACRRSLGPFCALWCVRVSLCCLLALWEYRRKTHRFVLVERMERGTNERNLEASRTPNNGNTNTPPRVRQMRSDSRGAWFKAIHIVSAFTTFSRLITLLSIAWFIAAHILVFAFTCRLSAPDIWLLTALIMALGYLILLKYTLTTFTTLTEATNFVLERLVFFVRFCTGSHPYSRSTPNNLPKVGKLQQKEVDNIPLVLYIPAPSPKRTMGKVPQNVRPPHKEKGDASILAFPKAAHVHSHNATERPTVSLPTLAANSSSQRSHRLFTFRKSRPRMPAKGKEKPSARDGSGDHDQSYEEKWERGEYPFVKLENNRAACAICLCDFEEPRRVRYSIDSRPPQDLDWAEQGMCGSPTKSQNDGLLRPAGAGEPEGAQPLRLLACAHVFHKPCLDRWLTEVLGRCPVCQRPVDPPGCYFLERDRSVLPLRRN